MKAIRVSQSFSEGEITVLSDILTHVQRSADQFPVARHPAFGRLARRVHQMKSKVHERKQQDAAE